MVGLYFDIQRAIDRHALVVLMAVVIAVLFVVQLVRVRRAWRQRKD
jgi:hypothetical protein